MTQVIIDAYQKWAEIDRKYPVNAGHYDRSHGDNIALGKRFAKLLRLIEEEGLDAPNTLAKLANLYGNR